MTVVHTIGNSGDTSQYNCNKYSIIHVLKLYHEEKSGRNQLVVRLLTCGIVKLNLDIQGSITGIKMKIPLPKNDRNQGGQVTFFTFDEGGALERVGLNVNSKNVETHMIFTIANITK